MTTQSPPSAEPEAVREHIATSIPRAEMKLDEAATEHVHYRSMHRSRGHDTWAALKDAARELVAVEQHEQRERAREGMDEVVRLAAKVTEGRDGDRDTLTVIARALLAANERIAALEAEVGRAREKLDDLCIEHVELNGILDTAREAVDYLDHEVNTDGDPSGKLRDFVVALIKTIEQCDRQRRRANWYEAAHEAGKQKLIESAVAKATVFARAEVEAATADYLASHAAGAENRTKVRLLTAEVEALRGELDRTHQALGLVAAERTAALECVAAWESWNAQDGGTGDREARLKRAEENLAALRQLATKGTP